MVLGARVTNGYPGALLTSRLEKAVQLARQFPLADVIVSGKGEADVMAEYLYAHGVDSSRVVVEPCATSTNENLERSRALRPEARVLHVVTNDFHGLRTVLWAWHLKIPVKVHTTLTPAEHRLKNYGREIIATPHSIARVLWRKCMAFIG